MMALVDQTQLHNYEELKEYISGFRHIFIVCGDSSFKHCAEQGTSYSLGDKTAGEQL